MYKLKPLMALIVVLGLHSISLANTGTWNSQVTGGEITFESTEATSPARDYANKYLTVVYLKNLAFSKVGQNSAEEDINWLVAQGYRVIALDYDYHPNAISPAINADIIAINDALASGSFAGYRNCSQYRSYVLFEGYRIKRDVGYFKDDPTVYNVNPQYTEGDSLYMDIIYPANPSEPVPVVLSFSYSNSFPTYDGDKGQFVDANKHQRLNLGYTLAGFNDSFLQGAPARAIAWAIADHPKYCNWGSGKPVDGANDTYKSYQTNPDAAQKVKSAVRTLRTLGEGLGLSGKIGIYGFSRGSDAGSMAVGDRSVAELEDAGIYTGSSDDVQAAALGSGVFDFTQIYNRLDDGDGNLETRCPQAWGPLEENFALWESMGSAYLAETSATAPILFFYNTTDSHYYQDQITQFKAKLDSLGVPVTTLVDYGSGHSVPQESADLTTLYDFFEEYLAPPALDTVSKPVEEPVDTTEVLANEPVDFVLRLAPNPVSEQLNLSFHLNTPGKVSLTVFNISGIAVYNRASSYVEAGANTDSLDLNDLQLPQGTYYLCLITESSQQVKRFVKVK